MRDVFDKLTEKKVTVFGVSTDDVATQKKFAESQKLPYELISDSDGEVAKAFGVPVKFGKFAARRAVLFQGGKLVWQDKKGATKSQGKDVIKALKAKK